jgi:hypothetical protein
MCSSKETSLARAASMSLFGSISFHIYKTKHAISLG